MSFIGYHSTNQALVTSQNDIVKENILDFLVDKYQDCQKVCYDVDCLLANLCVLLQLTREQCQTLLDKGKLFLSDGFRITYSPSHFLAIDYGYGALHGYANFANMNQVGYLTAQYSADNSIEDAIKKAREARNVAIQVGRAFNVLGLDGIEINSPISAFIKKQKFEYFPTVSDCPSEVAEMAYKGIRGQWFESYTMGETYAWDYDLNGSYAYNMAQMPNIKQGQWITSNTIPDGATLGVADGLLITEAPFHPFMVRIGQENNYTPTGRMPNVMTLQAIQFLRKRQLGEFKIFNGHFFISSPNNKSPYAGIMRWLYAKKQASIDKRTRAILTRVYSSIWGKSLEVKDDKDGTSYGGDFFNPIIGLTVETMTRLQVAEICFRNHLNPPLAVMADGFVSDKECQHITLNNGLGNWKLSAKGKCIIAGSGAITFEGKEPPEGLALKYDSLIDQINGNSNATEYTRTKYSPVSLSMALSDNGIFEELGTVKEIKRTLYIGNDTKRFYGTRPKTGTDLISGKLYESSPLDYGML